MSGTSPLQMRLPSIDPITTRNVKMTENVEPNAPNKERFDVAAKTWDEDPRRLLLAQTIVNAILERVPVDPQMDALDYGCGTGLVTLLLAPRIRRILGADISEGMLTVLRNKIQSGNFPNVETMILDLQCDPPINRNFGLIVSSMAMHHIRNVGLVIEKLVEMLQPGGWLCIADLEAESGDFHRDKTGVEHFGFEHQWIKQMLERAGLESVAVDTILTTQRQVGEEMKEFRIFLARGCRLGNHLLQ